MAKTIVGLTVDPYTVDLADQPCALFLDPNSGQIFLDQGAGDDRVNGAVLFPDRRPRFAVVGRELVLHYASWRFEQGELADLPAAEAWAASANRVLAARAGPTAGDPA